MGAMKIVLGVAVACALGALAGAYAMSIQAEKQVADLARERDVLQERVQKLQKQVEDLLRLAQREEQAAAGLKAELEQARGASVAPLAEGAQTASKGAAAKPEGWPSSVEVPEDPQRGALRNAPQLAPEEQAQRREEYAQRLRERVQSLVDDEIQRTPDSAAQQRLLALREQADAMVEALRNVQETSEDEPERAEALEQFQLARAATVSMVREHQYYTLRQLAAQNGITEPQKQEAFVESILQLQQSPFFQAPMFMEDPEGSGVLR